MTSDEELSREGNFLENPPGSVVNRAFEGLSRKQGNLHERFLGEGALETGPPYPTLFLVIKLFAVSKEYSLTGKRPCDVIFGI